MNDDQLLRYSRHILLDEIGVEGQEKLRAAHALVIGAGGLGSPVGLYLGTAGMGTITLVDHDRVDLTNLQRQIAHDMGSLGRLKGDSAAETLTAIIREELSWQEPRLVFVDDRNRIRETRSEVRGPDAEA